MFVCMDEALIAQTVRDAKSRVVLCIPGFGDVVGAAVIEAHQRLPAGQLLIVVDGTDKAARLGYGHFDAVFQVLQAGVPMRLEQGLRLGVLVADEQGWCFATPPLLVDATMEQATAPNALALNLSQIQPTLQALGYVQPAPKVEPLKASSGKAELAGKAENTPGTEAPKSVQMICAPSAALWQPSKLCNRYRKNSASIRHRHLTWRVRCKCSTRWWTLSKLK